jgi:uncharacterized protein YebE (UPF0316 family)
MELPFLNGDSILFTWVVLPLLIFLSRIADQSIGTMRLIFVSKGYKLYAPLLGFFEVIIWLVAVSQILQHMNNVLYYIAYGAGFAAGNYIGILLEEKISLGTVAVRIIPTFETNDLVNYLKENNFGLTMVNAEGTRGPVKMLFLIMPRKQVKKLVDIINKFNPHAFYSIEDVKSAKHGIIRQDNPVFWKPKLPQLWRKGK